MTEHFPECAYDKPCPDEWRNARTIKSEGLPIPHRIVSGSSGRCVECEAGDCICDELRACEARLLEGRPDPGISEKQAIANYAIYQNGYAFGLGKARETVAALLAYDSPYGPLIRSDVTLAAIDALREEEKP